MAQQQSSHLHRLLTLLDTGSTQATRFTVAKQIGEIGKSHPYDLLSLLSKGSTTYRIISVADEMRKTDRKLQ